MSAIKPWWVGVRTSDVTGVGHLFSGLVALIGSFPTQSVPSFSIEDICGRRLDHNSRGNAEVFDRELTGIVRSVLQQAPESKFFFQDHLCYTDSKELWSHSVFSNPHTIISSLNDKALCRSLIGRHVPSVGSTVIFTSEVSYDTLRDMFPRARRFVVQDPKGGGGHGTIVVEKPLNAGVLSGFGGGHVVVSEFAEGMVPLNQHVVVFPEQVVVLSSSAQIVAKDENDQLLYKGCDFFLPPRLPKVVRDALNDHGRKIGDLLRRSGYRGVVGIDYLADENSVLFVEINPRFQASSSVLNRFLLDQGLASLHQMHIDAFSGGQAPELPASIPTPGAAINVSQRPEGSKLEPGLRHLTSPDSRDTAFSRDEVTVNVDLLCHNSTTLIDDGASLGRIEVDRPVLFFDRRMGVLSDPTLSSLGAKPPQLIKAAAQGDVDSLARLKFHLFCHGATLSRLALRQLAMERKDLTIRDGIAGGIEILLPGRVHINTPVKEYFALLSPFEIDWKAPSGTYILRDGHGDCVPIRIMPIPDFVGRVTTRGTPMVSVGQMFNERLSIEVFFGCSNNAKAGTACHFCELGAETRPHYADLSDVRELVAYCEASPTISMRHVLIGGGTPPAGRWSIYLETLAAVREGTKVPTYMMLAPPDNLLRLDELQAAGLNEIGMNMEVFDRSIARDIMPVKGRLELSDYFSALEHAVSLWGAEGAVRSILIVGIEPLESTLAGVEALCQRGVLPILSPYRPVPGTPLANHPPPSPELMYEAWTRGQELALAHGLTLGPTCVACQNNTIAMPHETLCRYY